MWRSTSFAWKGREMDCVVCLWVWMGKRWWMNIKLEGGYKWIWLLCFHIFIIEIWDRERQKKRFLFSIDRTLVSSQNTAQLPWGGRQSLIHLMMLFVQVVLWLVFTFTEFCLYFEREGIVLVNIFLISIKNIYYNHNYPWNYKI